MVDEPVGTDEHVYGSVETRGTRGRGERIKEDTETEAGQFNAKPVPKTCSALNASSSELYGN